MNKDILRTSKRYSVVSMDITSHCNARCEFCFNEWGPPSCMEHDIFLKTLELLPLCKSPNFLLSCAYEPSLHPNFTDWMLEVPPQYKSGCLLTTNLVKSLSDTELKKLAHASVGTINVSLETFDDETYQNLTHVKNTHFYDNLLRMAEIFHATPDAPKLHLITMILKDNYEELPKIAQKAQELYHPDFHEFRTPFFFPSAASRKLERHLVTCEEIADISEKILSANPNAQIQKSLDLHEYQLHQDTGPDFFEEPYLIRIEANGTGFFTKYDWAFVPPSDPSLRFDLHLVEHPFLHFADQLLLVQQKDAERYQLPFKTPASFQYSDNISFCIDNLILYDERFLEIEGWAFSQNAKPKNRAVFVEHEGTTLAYCLRDIERLDVCMVYHDDTLLHSGFKCLIDLKQLHYQYAKPVVFSIGYHDEQNYLTSKVGKLCLNEKGKWIFELVE